MVHIRMVHLIAHTGTDLPVSLPLPAECMRRALTRKTAQGSGDIPKALSPQLLEWFSSEETLEVTEITALPHNDLNLSLLVNRSVRSKEVAIQGMQALQPKARTSPSNSEHSIASAVQRNNTGKKGEQIR